LFFLFSDCGILNVANGFVDGNETTYTAVIYVECETGYVLSNGVDTVSCGADGNWSSYPTCEIIGSVFENITYT